MERIRNVVEPALFFLLLAGIWEFAVDLFQIKVYLLPPISTIAVRFWEARALLWTHAVITTFEVLLGLALAIVFGAAIGIWCYFSATARRNLYPLVAAMQGIPKVALAPLFVVWLGYGLASKVTMAFLFAFFPIVIGTIGGLASTPASLEEHFHALKSQCWTTFRRLRLPSALPNFIDGCKVAVPLAVVGAIVGEFVGAESGLGYLLLLANSSAKTDLVFASIIAVSLVSVVLYFPIHFLGRLIWWRGL